MRPGLSLIEMVPEALDRRMGKWHRHARSVALLCIGLSLAIASCRRPAEEDRLNIRCVTRLRLPEYPPIAQSAWVALSITVAVPLSADGSSQPVTFENVSGSRPDLVELFRPAVEQAVRQSRFEAACGGKTVRFVFSFQLDPNGPLQAVYFRFPNQFEIEAQAPKLNISRNWSSVR